MSKDTTSESKLQQDAENNLNSPTFERAIHNKENPYVMIDRSLTRNSVLSFEARGFLLYLLSHSDKWVISRQHIMNTQNIKWHSLKKIIDELINAGYICMERYQAEKGYRRVKYLVSEFPQFKENIPHIKNPCEEFPREEKQPTKKEQKEKKEQINKESKSHSPSPEAQELVKFFIACLRKNKPDIKIPDNFFKWHDCMDKILKYDKRTVENIQRLIEWVTADSFWKANILSPEKLRKKFDQLEIKMDSESNPQSQETNSMEQNRKIAEDIVRKFPRRSQSREVGVFNSYIEFKLGGQSASIRIEFDEKDFKKVLQSALLKWGNHD